MKDLEANKIAAAILIAGLIAMICGKIANALYEPKSSDKRGFQVAVQAEESADKTIKKEEVLDIAALMASANAERGKKNFSKCSSCHSLEQGKNLVGPSLYGVVGRKFASDSGYNYSKALKSTDKSWGYAELLGFLKKPKKYVPGTKMNFLGIKKPQQIADLIAYLRENHDNPPALP